MIILLAGVLAYKCKHGIGWAGEKAVQLPHGAVISPETTYVLAGTTSEEFWDYSAFGQSLSSSRYISECTQQPGKKLMVQVKKKKKKTNNKT